MSEVPRIPPTGGAEGSGRKDRASVDDDKFKKLMRVDEVHEIDPHEKRNRKRREETEEEAEEEAKKAGASHARKGVKPIEGDAGGPLDRKKVSPRAVPATPATPHPPERAAPMAAFDAGEIEAYAWKEEEEGAAARTTAAPSTSQEIPASKTLTKSPTGEAATQQVLGKTPPGLQPPAATTPPAPQPPLFSVEADLIKEEVPMESVKPYAEEWPHTTSYSPTPAFRREAPSPEPSIEKAPARKAEPDRRDEEGERRKPKEAPIPPKKKTPSAPQEGAAPPGIAVSKGKKEKAASFAELMEEGTEKKPKESKAAEKQPTVPTAGKAPTSEVTKEGILTALPSKETISEASKIPAAEKLSLAAIEGVQAIPSAEESFAFLKKTGGATILPEKAKGEEEVKERGLLPAVGPPPEGGTGMGGEGGGEKRRGKGEVEEAAAIAAAAGAPAATAPALPAVEAPAPTAPSPYSQMSPQILALFERMVGVMTIIQTTGISETVLTLNARQFAASVLYGSQIIIREFSTAPTAFNVEFVGSAAALTLVQQNIPGLLGAVQQGNFNFTINRFDVKLSGTERPIFSRKEPPREEGGEEEKEKEKET